MIKPTVGRIVWFWPANVKPSQPNAAIVAHVFNERLVTLTVFDRVGVPFAAPYITLLQDDDVPVVGRPYCEWMPYQVGQAKKHEVEK